MTNVKQPILILQGALDKQVLPYHADKLAELARGRKKAASVEVKQLPGAQSPVRARQDRRRLRI